MAGVVTFDYQAWIMRYPEFAGVPSGLAGLYFDEATIYCQNQLGPVQDVGTLAALLRMVTAHIAKLNAPVSQGGRGVDAPPGRIDSVTEGSVSVSFNMDLKPGSEQWWGQTTYGIAYWQATKVYRTMHYIPGKPGPASLAQLPWGWPSFRF